MKAIQLIFILFISSFLISCGGDVPSNQNTNNSSSDSSELTTDNQSDTENPPESNNKPAKCEIEGNVLDGNTFYAEPSNLVIRIVATEATKDPELGDSHRVLEIYDGSTCELIDSKVLPVDGSPDFHYTIADLTYNSMNQIVAIKGFSTIYAYDAKTQTLSNKLTPKFINERFLEDAQTGMINHLEVWENYLIGYAQGMGTFVFELRGSAPKVVEPFAEFEVVEGELYNTMFMLKSSDDAYQVILPQFDYDSESLSINPVFSTPKNLDSQVNPRYRNNRFQILKESTDGKKMPIAIDMKQMKRLDIPDDILTKKNTEIIEWAKSIVQ
jgi:hypothetical protein